MISPLDDLDDLPTSGDLTSGISTPVSKMMQTLVTPSSAVVLQKGKDLDKFGSQYAQDAWPLSTSQERWQRLGLTYVCALMASSLSYTWYSSVKPTPLAPQPWFILVLVTMLPTATLGALIVQIGRAWRPRRAINLFLTGVASALLGLSAVEFIWQLASRGHINSWAQLLVMLLVSSTGATIGVHGQPHHKVMDTIVRIRAILRRTRLLLTSGGIAGALAGFGLTFGFGFDIFTVFGILLSIAVGVGLVWRVDYLVKINRRQKA